MADVGVVGREHTFSPGRGGGMGVGGGGGHLERELMANSIQKTMRLDLPGGPAAKTSQLPLQVAWVPSLV